MNRHWGQLAYFARQALIVGAVGALLTWLAIAIRAGLARNGIAFDMGFLGSIANFDISEGSVPTLSGLRVFNSSDSNGEALLVGFINTVKVSALAIVASTVLGTLLGAARVSRNWLARQLSFGFVEFVRNTPLLIQLVFWYFAVALKLPAFSDAASWFGSFVFTQQGIYVPALMGAGGASVFAVWSLLIAIVCAGAAISPGRPRGIMLLASSAAILVTFALGFPIALSLPVVHVAGVTGGFEFSPECCALFAALSIYTAAFIAEIVRGAILALPKGQWEAAAALGMGKLSLFFDVVMPQVFRVVMPAFGNQYISLAKSTSLGIAIGYSDLFNVYGTVANQSGRSLEGVIVVMLAYLFLSWAISGLVNVVNARMLKAGGVR